jgi:hypothetical protein
MRSKTIERRRTKRQRDRETEINKRGMTERRWEREDRKSRKKIK